MMIVLQMNLRRLIRSKLFISVFSLLLSVGLRAQVGFWTVRPTFDAIDVMAYDLVKVERNGIYGLTDYDGNIVVDCLYDEITCFKDGYALLIKDGIAKGCVNLDGKIRLFDKDYIVDLNYPYYSDGMLAVKYNGRWGYLDQSGNVAIPCRYRNALPFVNGLASVSDVEGYFMHIGKTGKISLLGDGFNDDDLKFATSFITDDKGETFSIVINSKWKAYKRDLTGKKLGNFELTGVSVDTKQRIIQSGKYALHFDSAWRLLRIDVQGNVHKEYVVNDELSYGYIPTQSLLKVVENQNGKFGLKINDKVCLPEQFDSVLPLDRARAIASIDGLFGFLQLIPDESVYVSLEPQSIVMNHHTESNFKGSVHLPYSLSDKKIEVSSVTYDKANAPIFGQSGTDFSFHYSPDDLTTEHKQEFEMKIKVDGLEYPVYRESVEFAHRFSFRVSAPDKVNLNQSGSCVFNIYIFNDSDQKSDECEIYVDDKLVKTLESFSPGQRVSASVAKSIKMEDEDLKTMILDIRVVEKGCPEYMVSKKITFERYYANN